MSRQRHDFSLRSFLFALIGLPCLLAVVSSSFAEQVSVRSGNGDAGPGSLDNLVTMLVGPESAEFPTVFTPQDFVAAANGPNARLTGVNPYWLPLLPGDLNARWINNSGSSLTGRSVLYAIPFTLSDPVGNATLNLIYAVDNYLGENSVLPSGNERPGVYLNGTPVPGSNGIGDFYTQHEFTADISDLLVQGVNVFYLYCYDWGIDAGLIFSATITTAPPSATERESWGLLKARFTH